MAAIESVIETISQGIYPQGIDFSKFEQGEESDDDKLPELFCIKPYTLGSYKQNFYAKDRVETWEAIGILDITKLINKGFLHFGRDPITKKILKIG